MPLFLNFDLPTQSFCYGSFFQTKTPLVSAPPDTRDEQFTPALPPKFEGRRLADPRTSNVLNADKRRRLIEFSRQAPRRVRHLKFTARTTRRFSGNSAMLTVSCHSFIILPVYYSTTGRKCQGNLAIIFAGSALCLFSRQNYPHDRSYKNKRRGSDKQPFKRVKSRSRNGGFGVAVVPAQVGAFQRD